MKALHWFLVFVGFILLIDLTIFVIANYITDTLIIKIPPLKRVYVFAHGEYTNTSEGYIHYTYLYTNPIKTEHILDQLRQEGYTHIWTSLCYQGNSNYVSEYSDGRKIEWGTDVSRVKKPGRILNIYIGLGILRIPIDD